MYKEEREQFLEKFRKDQGLDNYNNKSILSNSQISVKTNNTHRPQYISNNKINVKNNTRKRNNEEEFNLQSSKYNRMNITTNQLPRRWDYLHQLEKTKQARIEEKKIKNQQEYELKLQKECTFSPTFYSKKNKISTSKPKITSFQNDDEGDKFKFKYMPEHSSSITNNNIVKYENSDTNNGLLECDVNQRTVLWTRKKLTKTENMKQELMDKELKECIFKPNLVRFHNLRI